MVSLARKNLLEDIPRFLVAQAGIMFAVGLVTLQTGIFNGFLQSTVAVVQPSQSDIWVASDTFVQLELTTPIPVSRLLDARRVPGVARAEGFVFTGAQWYPLDGEMARVRLVAFDPQGELYTPDKLVEGNLSSLSEPYVVMIDETDRDVLYVANTGEEVRINTLPARVVGLTRGNTSMTMNPFVLTSLENAKAFVSSGQTSSVSCQLPAGSSELECINTFSPSFEEESADPPPVPAELVASDLITYILIEAEPGENLQALKRSLDEALPGTRAFTQAELSQKTQTYWEQRTGIGFILGMGAVVGIIVGIVVVGQILYSSVSDHLKEFGTLKAMGASAPMIYGVIVEQALWMALLGYLPGMASCLAVSAWAQTSQGILILITPVSASAVLGITVLMCVGAASFAIQKVNRVDPAIVFKA